MGLDMYLTKKTHCGFEYEHRREEDGSIPLTTSGKISHIKPERVSEISERIGYWRKANAIHSWFVKEVQEGADNCGEYYVTRSKLKELLEAVNLVLATIDTAEGTVNNGQRMTEEGWEPIQEAGVVVTNPSVASGLLPTQPGFFFGGTDYDQWYVADLKLTQEIITAALADPVGDFYYSSSW